VTPARIEKRGDAVAVYFRHEAVDCRVVIRAKLAVEPIKVMRGVSEAARCAGGHTTVDRYESRYEVRGTDALGDLAWTSMRNPPSDMLAAALFAVGSTFGDAVLGEPTPPAPPSPTDQCAACMVRRQDHHIVKHVFVEPRKAFDPRSWGSKSEE
jgi:hypothetical protein